MALNPKKRRVIALSNLEAVHIGRRAVSSQPLALAGIAGTQWDIERRDIETKRQQGAAKHMHTLDEWGDGLWRL